MKKLTFLLAGLILFATTTFGQAIDDRAVIPVAINLNSILRLNVVSGGNIEFNFNTLEDYTLGINSTGDNPGYQTRFTVASSVDWNVFIYAEDLNLRGTDNVVNTNLMGIDNIGIHVDYDGSGDADHYDYVSDDPDFPAALTISPNTVLVGVKSTDAVPIAGDVNRNAFIINWRCGTQQGDMLGSSILDLSLAADRYATNVFLTLQPAD